MAGKRQRKLQKTSRTWRVLNYAVCEPNEWTCRAIAEDLEDNFQRITAAASFLAQKGYIVKGVQIGNSKALFPTPKGVEALHTAV
tara:strand:- start:373 stop:627 length:255 start_codon:yes stop_codon:yes gene_type:complete